MTPARWGVLLPIIAALAAAAAFALSRPREAAAKPKLLLLTSLPLVFGEDFGLQDTGSAALTTLQQHYRVVPISVTNDKDLARGRLLLMAQPLAQTADNLVSLDAWVRKGGRLMLLADPLLEWPSRRALGDPLRPPAVFMDTGLLQHWGLRLDPPQKRGPQSRRLGDRNVLTVSPGWLSGGCKIAADHFVAHCRIGAGEATIVADGDFLNLERPDASAQSNLDGLIVELAKLTRP